MQTDYKGKGNSLERGNYRGLKLTDQILKIAEKNIEKLIRQQVDIGEMQFGFKPEYRTTNVIFILTQLQEKYEAKRKNLYFVFVDLEKAFDRMSRDVVWWASRKQGVEERLVKIIQLMYRNTRSHIKISGTFSDDFLVQVGIHEGSVLSPLLFIMLLEAVS